MNPCASSVGSATSAASAFISVSPITSRPRCPSMGGQSIFPGIANPQFEFYRFFTLAVESICIERVAEACHSLRELGEINIEAPQEVQLVTDFSEYPATPRLLVHATSDPSRTRESASGVGQPHEPSVRPQYGRHGCGPTSDSRAVPDARLLC